MKFTTNTLAAVTVGLAGVSVSSARQVTRNRRRLAGDDGNMSMANMEEWVLCYIVGYVVVVFGTILLLPIRSSNINI